MSDESETEFVPTEQCAVHAADPAHAQRVEKLFRQINEPLVRLLRARIGSSQDARDIAQETYAVLLARNELGAILDWEPYAFRVALNMANNRFTQGSRRREIDERLPVDVDDRRSPELICAARDDLELISQAANELPPLVRAALELKAAGESPATIAERLGVLPRRARRLLARALAHLLTALDCEKRGGHKQ